MVEMMWTVAILSILAAIAIPGFTKWLPSYNLKSAARDVFSNIQLAKLDAVKRNRSCITTVDTGNNKYTIGLFEGDREVNMSDYDNNVLIKNTSDNSITFNSRGLLNDAADRFIYITNTQNTATWRIRVTRSGSISLGKE
jgi:Tfp pilus assembly protein FimT